MLISVVAALKVPGANRTRKVTVGAVGLNSPTAETRSILGNLDTGRTTTGLNAWLAVTLMALGLHNLPLAAPSLLNIGYRLHSRRATGMAIVSVAVVFNVALFIGALVFMASGQSFEQFSGME